MGWQTIPLGELCNVLDSKRKPITKRDRISGEIPYYGATGVVDYVRDFLFDEKLVLVGEDGAKWESGDATAFVIEGKTWVNNHAHVLRPNRQALLDEWLAYYLTHLDLTPFVGGLTVPKLNQGSLREIPVVVPPLEEQKRIVAILDKAFEGIAKATANAERNLVNARELFERSVAKILVETQFESVSSVRELAVARKGAIRTGPFGSQLLHSEFTDDGPVAVLGIDNVVKNEFRWKRRRYISEEKYAGLKRYTVTPGDVLISIMGTCGRCAIVPEDIELAINSKHLCCITLDQSKCLPEYLHTYFLYHPTALQYLTAQSKGSIMDGLNMGIIQDMPVELPSIQDQQKIAAIASNLQKANSELLGKYEEKLICLDDLRKVLLHKAFSGELTTTNERRPNVNVGLLEDTASPQYTADVLAFAYAKHRSAQRDRTFGRVKGQKVLHLVEAVAGVDLGRNPIKDAAGPNDSAHMRRAEDWAAQQGYFAFEARGTGGYDFRPGRSFEKTLASAYARLSPHKDAIARVIDLLVPMDSQEAEVLATVQAAWNNLIIDGVEPTRDAIVAEARENWSASKLEIPVTKFENAIRFIRQNDITPDGSAKPVRNRQESLF